ALAVRAVFAFFSNDWFILANSAIIGGLFLGLGLSLYAVRQWGDGDAWLLGALGFLFPEQLSFGLATYLPYPLAVLFNFLMISLVYLISYSIYLGIKNKSMNKKYIKLIKEEKNKFAGLTTFFFAFSWIFSFVMIFQFSMPIGQLTQIILLPFLLTFILFFTYYAKTVEKYLFKKKIKTSELREGDVILDGRWKGITIKEIDDLKKRKKEVWIKEGVRFAPVFVITMLISIFFGNLLFIFI
ncbi:MAG: hypothetical protein KAS32_17435, partial [Candidatus Peribacteraceae bacterium]|nr:hypothetical protein [Candidatus Peribacteraceae bacterium]